MIKFFYSLFWLFGFGIQFLLVLRLYARILVVDEMIVQQIQQENNGKMLTKKEEKMSIYASLAIILGFLIFLFSSLIIL